MLHGPLNKSGYTHIFESIVKALVKEPSSVNFYFDDNDDKKNILLTIKDPQGKIFTYNFTEILENTNLSHVLLQDKTLAQLQANAHILLPELTTKTYTFYQELEKRALKQYSSGGPCAEINDFLRKRYNKIWKDFPPLDNNEYIKRKILLVALTASALNKHLPGYIDPRMAGRAAYRGEKLPPHMIEERKKKVLGKEISREDAAFWSTSDSSNVASRFASNKEELTSVDLTPSIVVLDNLYGIDILRYSIFGSSESEFLMLPSEIEWYKMTPETDSSPITFYGRHVRALNPLKENQNRQFHQTPEYQNMRQLLHPSIAKFTGIRFLKGDFDYDQFSQMPKEQLLELAEKNHEIKSTLIRQTEFVEQIKKYLIAAIKDGNEKDFDRLIQYASTYILSEALLVASEKGRYSMVEKLLQNGANVRAVDALTGETALIKACKNGHEDIIKLLLNNKSEIDARDYNGYTSLMWAVKEGRNPIFKLLLQNKANVNVKSEKDDTAILLAIEREDEEMVSMLLNNAALLGIANRDKITPIILALLKGNEVLTNMLLSKGATINKQMLLRAVEINDSTLLSIVLKSGIDVNAEDDTNGLTALDNAVRDKNIALAKKLIEHGADVNHKDRDGNCIFLTALMNCDIEMMKLLISHGADIGLLNQNKSGQNLNFYLEILKDVEPEKHEDISKMVHTAMKTPPLIRATVAGNAFMVQKLLESGCSDTPANDGFTALAKAILKKQSKIAELIMEKTTLDPQSTYARQLMTYALDRDDQQTMIALQKKGFDVNAPDTNGVTLLMWAAKESHEDIVKHLLSLGADPYLAINGQTAFDYAEKSWKTAKKDSIVTLLAQTKRPKSLTFSDQEKPLPYTSQVKDSNEKKDKFVPAGSKANK